MSIRRIILAISAIASIGFTALQAQTQVAVFEVTPDDVPTIDAVIHPLATMQAATARRMVLMVLPIEEFTRVPADQLRGRSFAFFSGRITSDTTLWGTDLRLVSQQNPTDPDSLVPVESYPSFDAERLASVLTYPEEARSGNLEGTVIIGALIGSDGLVEKIDVVSSDDPVFNAAAGVAVLATRFEPGVATGEAVKMWVRIPVVFKLH